MFPAEAQLAAFLATCRRFGVARWRFADGGEVEFQATAAPEGPPPPAPPPEDPDPYPVGPAAAADPEQPTTLELVMGARRLAAV